MTDAGMPAAEGAAALRTAVVWEEGLAAYDFGPGHPMSPVRLELTAHLCRLTGLFDRPGTVLIGAPTAADADLERVHDREFIAAVRAASAPGAPSSDPRWTPYGLGGQDTPVFRGIHDASARLVGGTVQAVEALAAGRAGRAVNFAGGMHHARAAQAAGFCVYNDAAIGIQRALELGERQIVYVDLDVHHGDGVERALWDEPRAVTISVHQSGETLFPGTGYAQDTGGPGAPGSAVNVPLPARTGPADWLRAIEAVVAPVVRAVRPSLLVTQHGADTHRDDPLADLDVTVEAQVAAMEMMRELAEEVCGGRWLALGGGGYSVTDVVPRSWTQLVAVATGERLDHSAPLPTAYVERAAELASAQGLPLPRPGARFGDTGERAPVPRPWSAGYDPDSALDRSIQAVRRTVFPEWGLDPFYD